MRLALGWRLMRRAAVLRRPALWLPLLRASRRGWLQRLGRYLHGQLEHAEGRPIRKVLPEQRRRHVVDRDVRLRVAFEAAVMSVSVQDRRHRVAVDRLFKAAAAQER